MLEKVGRYRLVEEIGRGSTGTVYRAEDTLIGRQVALKTVARPGVTSPPQELEAYTRFLRESQAAGRLSHPSVVTIFDVGEDVDAGVSFIAMELIEGEPLDRVLRAHRRLGFDEIRRIGIDVATALDKAHRAGIVHRDVKPANLLRTASGAVKVTDFGIAKIASASATQDGTLLGSPNYMSPEQVQGGPIDHRSDLFALGTVLYELTTLRPAFPGKGVFEVVAKVARAQFTPPREINRDIPEDLEQVILRAMARDPNQRFPTAEAMRLALEMVPARVDVPLPSPSAGSTTTVPESVAVTTVALATAAGASAPVAAAASEPLARVAAPGAVAPRLAPGPASGWSQRKRRPAWLAATGALAAVAAIALVALIRAGSERTAASAAAPVIVAAASGAGAAAPAATSPLPAPSPQVRALAVVHDHRIGSCTGTLRAFPDHLEFDSSDDKEDRVWAYRVLHDLEVGRDEVHFQVEEREAATLGLRDRRYAFHAAHGGVPAAMRGLLEARIESGRGGSK